MVTMLHRKCIAIHPQGCKSKSRFIEQVVFLNSLSLLLLENWLSKWRRRLRICTLFEPCLCLWLSFDPFSFRFRVSQYPEIYLWLIRFKFCLLILILIDNTMCICYSLLFHRLLDSWEMITWLKLSHLI